ncbi:nucleotidyl transferase AbiEii/AbiGii toxin family protein [Photorhabdus temperata subsp. temperata]
MDSHISQYREQVRLLINSLTQVAKEKCFALKGGTAINLFVMDSPRLSVDIDLAYVPVSDRTTDLKAISEALDRIVTDLNTKAGIRAEKLRGQGEEIRIHVYSRETMIKIEVNHVWRGLLINPSELEVSERVEDEFGFAAINVVSRPDLYGGKVCAALDRQHPRDFFDIKMLMDSTGIASDIYYGFLAYLLGHNRPMADLLNPNWKNNTKIFETEFQGMTRQDFSLDELNTIPQQMLAELKRHFTQQDFDFLISYKQLEPEWRLFPYNIEHLPAIRWKQRNLRQLKEKNPEKWAASVEKLKVTLLCNWLN